MKKLKLLLLFCVITSCSTQNLAINYENPSLACENCDEID